MIDTKKSAKDAFLGFLVSKLEQGRTLASLGYDEYLAAYPGVPSTKTTFRQYKMGIIGGYPRGPKLTTPQVDKYRGLLGFRARRKGFATRDGGLSGHAVLDYLRNRPLSNGKPLVSYREYCFDTSTPYDECNEESFEVLRDSLSGSPLVVVEAMVPPKALEAIDLRDDAYVTDGPKEALIRHMLSKNPKLSHYMIEKRTGENVKPGLVRKIRDSLHASREAAVLKSVMSARGTHQVLYTAKMGSELAPAVFGVLRGILDVLNADSGAKYSMAYVQYPEESLEIRKTL